MTTRILLSLLLALPAPAIAATACYDTNGDGIADTCSTTRNTLFRGTVTRTRPLYSRRVVRSTRYASTPTYRSYSSHGGYGVAYTTSNYGSNGRYSYSSGCPTCGRPYTIERDWTPRDYEAAGKPVPKSMRGPDYSGYRSESEKAELPTVPTSFLPEKGSMPLVSWSNKIEGPMTAWLDKSNSWYQPRLLLATN